MNATIYTFPRGSDSTYHLVVTDELPGPYEGKRVLVLQRINPLGRRMYESTLGAEAVIALTQALFNAPGR